MTNIAKKKNYPTSVKILDIEYSIEYKDNPSEVDIYKRDSLWGQIDYWTRTIRIYDNGKPSVEIYQTILHEVLHGIVQTMHIKLNKDDEERIIDLMATGLNNVILNNDWIGYKE